MNNYDKMAIQSQLIAYYKILTLTRQEINKLELELARDE